MNSYCVPYINVVSMAQVGESAGERERGGGGGYRGGRSVQKWKHGNFLRTDLGRLPILSCKNCKLKAKVPTPPPCELQEKHTLRKAYLL